MILEVAKLMQKLGPSKEGYSVGPINDKNGKVFGTLLLSGGEFHPCFEVETLEDQEISFFVFADKNGEQQVHFYKPLPQ